MNAFFVGLVVVGTLVIGLVLCLCRAAAWADEAREDALRKVVKEAGFTPARAQEGD